MINKKEVKKFFDYISLGQPQNSVFYNTLLARPKYLTVEERNEINCANNMLDIALYTPHKHYDNFVNYYRNIAKFSCDIEAYLGKSGKPIINKARAIYAGINPVDLIKARENYLIELATLERRAMIGDIDFGIVCSGMPRLYLKHCTNAQVKKNIVDIDVDIKPEYLNMIDNVDPSYAKIYKDAFNSFIFTLADTLTADQLNDILFVFTRGGFHVLSRTRYFCREWHTELLETVTFNAFDGIVTEVKQNRNAMCPLPGTMQCAHEVYCKTGKELVESLFAL